MAASPSIISTGDSGYPDSNWSGGGPTPKASSSESSVTSSKNGNNSPIGSPFITVVSIAENPKKSSDNNGSHNNNKRRKSRLLRNGVEDESSIQVHNNNNNPCGKMLASNSSSSNNTLVRRTSACATASSLTATSSKSTSSASGTTKRTSSTIQQDSSENISANSAAIANNNSASTTTTSGYVTVLEIGSSTSHNNAGTSDNFSAVTSTNSANNLSLKRASRRSNPPSRTPSFNRSSSAGTVTVQIKTNKSTKGGLVQRSASVSSDLSRKKSEEKCSTLPRRGSKDNNFVHRGISSVEEDITIYKLPGEKLGLGLRFDGGARANEYVNRLFVQCCSKGSPSARTRCTWGTLNEGDEIVSISSKLVRRMTRVDCVKALKESPVSIKMRIRHYFSHLSINSASASYDVRQGFDKQFCVDFIDQDCDVDHSNNTTSSSHNINSNNRDRKCQTAPRKPCRPSLGGGGTSSTSGQNSVSSQQQPRSSSVPTLVTNNSENSKPTSHPRNRAGNRIRTRNSSLEVSPTSSVTGTTRSIIERTRSATRAGMLSSEEKAATLPRKSGGMFVKAHQTGHRKTTINKNSSNQMIRESFVDDGINNGILVEDDNKPKTQTLPRSYKTGMGGTGSKTRKGSTDQVAIPTPNRPIGRAQSTNSVMDHGIHLVVSSNSFVSRGHKQPIRPVLTVQEKLTQEVPSLPPQAEVYVNLLEGETVDESSSSLVEIPSINELPAKNASEKTDLPPHTQQQLQQNSIISSPIISNSVQSQSITNNVINNAAHFGNNLDQIYLVEESDEASSVSTLSTIQHITPLATPTKGQSKRTTPQSSFSSHDRTKPQQSFDLAKLLDPFEQLEREFNWEDVTTLKPPSAFCSLVDVRGEDLQQKQENSIPDGNGSAVGLKQTAAVSKKQQQNVEQSLQRMKIGSYQTLDPRRSRKDLFQPKEDSVEASSVLKSIIGQESVTSSSHPRPLCNAASTEVVQGSLCSNSNHHESSCQQPQLSSSTATTQPQTQIEASGASAGGGGTLEADEADDASGVKQLLLQQQDVIVKEGGSLNLNEQYESEAYPPNTPTYYETTREFDVDAILFSNSSNTTSAYFSADLEGAQQAFCRPAEAEWPLPPLEPPPPPPGAAAASLRLLSAAGQLVSKGTLTEQDVVGVDGEYYYLPTSASTTDVPEVAIGREHVVPEQNSVLEPVSVDSEDSDSAASETNTIVEVVVVDNLEQALDSDAVVNEEVEHQQAGGDITTTPIHHSSNHTRSSSATSNNNNNNSGGDTTSTNMEIFASHHHLQNQHSLSQDSTSEGSLMMIGGGQGPPPPPTLSRLPPDGHEFPPDYRDPSASSSSNSNNFQNSEMLSRKSSASSTGSLDRSTNGSSNQNNVEKAQNKQKQSRPMMKHDEHSASSVRAKIAMFSNAKQSRLRDRAAENSSVNSSTSASNSGSSSLTRSLTHGDVRFEEVQPLTNNNKSNSINPKANHLGYRSMVNMNKEFNQSTDSLVRTTHARLSRLSSDNSKFGGRSQSLMEIGAGLPKRTMSSERKTPSPHSRSQSSSGIETPELPIDQRRKNTLTKMKGLVIPEVNNEAMASPPPPPTSNTTSPASNGTGNNNNTTNKLSPPPWKSTSEVPSKYSPAYKRKPFTVYGNTSSSNNSNNTSVVNNTEKSRLVPASTGSKNNNNHSNVSVNTSTAVKSDDSDNDSAVSSGRSSLSHSSVSPPASPKSAKNNLPRNLANSTTSGETIQESPIRLDSIRSSESTSSSSAEIVTDPRVLKKDSVEAINRRNILESCKKSSAKPDFKTVSGWNSGRPASRSSSFTIAERKKSFEMMNSAHRTLGESKITNTHSSQDSLSSSRKASREYDSAFTSRRPSKEVSEEFNPNNSRRSSRGSESIVDTIKDIENRVAYMSDIVNRHTGNNGIMDDKMISASVKANNNVVHDEKWSTLEKKYMLKDQDQQNNERPKALPPFGSQGQSSSRRSSITKISPGSKTIKELTERWESRSSLTSNEASPPSGGKDWAQTPTNPAPGPALGHDWAQTPTNPTPGPALGHEWPQTPTNPAPGGPSAVALGQQMTSNTKAAATIFLPSESEEWESFDPSTTPEPPNNSVILNHSTPTGTVPVIPDRKFSVPALYSGTSGQDSGSVKLRDNKNKNAVPSRPSSLIETGLGTELKVFEMGHLGDHGGIHRNGNGISASTSRGSSQADLLECSTTSDTPKSPLPGSSSRELLEVFGGRTPSSDANSTLGSTTGVASANGNGGRRCVSVNDIRRAFEKAEQSLQQAAAKGYSGMSPCHNRMSSLDSTNSDESSIPTPQHCYGSVSSLISGQTNMRDHYGSISSLASSTSLISPQELQGLIDEANQSLEESGTPSHEIMVIVLHREFTAGSIGITLAGGADYENKEITVHKVIPGTLADRDGRIQKGDRVLSINGRSTKGVTHREALSILKAPRAEVVLVLSRSRSVTPHGEGAYDRTDYPSYNYLNSGRPPKILESPLDSKSLLSDLKFVDVPRGSPRTVVLKKEGTGLGFSLEGGKDSPLGDRPLTIKKIFTGGAADKSGVLKVGDEIISVNNTDCTRMSRIEAWNFMKKLNDGTATIVVRQKIEASEAANTPKPLEVKANAGNQDNMTTCEQKEKLEAKR